MQPILMTCLLAAAAAGLAGCAASSKAPTQAQIEARNAVIAAQKVVEPGSSDAAKLNLARAQRDVRTGDKLVAQRKPETARLYYERAQAEANAADAIACAEVAEKQASTAEARLDTAKEVERDADE